MKTIYKKNDKKSAEAEPDRITPPQAERLSSVHAVEVPEWIPEARTLQSCSNLIC